LKIEPFGRSAEGIFCEHLGERGSTSCAYHVAMTPKRRAAWSVVLVAAIVVVALLDRRARMPPSPRPVDADVTAFSATRAVATLARVLGPERPHPTGSPENAAVRARLVEELRALGLAPREIAADACSRYGRCAHPVNVLARLPGQLRASGAILLAAHYDSTPAGPGAADDGAGVAALLEIARALEASPALAHDVVFAITDAEEAGLVGAEALRAEPSLADVRAFANLEARGTEGPAMMFRATPRSAGLVRAYAGSASHPVTSSLFAEVFRRMPNDTDATVFGEMGLRGLDFAFVHGAVRYHQPEDRIAALSPASVQDVGDAALSFVRAADRLDLVRDDAVDGAPIAWFDLLARATLVLPQSAMLPLAIASLLLLALAVALDRDAISRRAAARSTIEIFVTLAFAAVGGAVFALALVFVGALPTAFVPRPTLPAIALAMIGVVGALVGRRVSGVPDDEAGAMGAARVGWIAWALAGVALAVVAPGASYPFVLPAAIASVVAVVGVRRAAWALPLSIVPIFAASLLWFPIVGELPEALGFVLPPLYPVAIAPIAIVALVAVPSRRAAGRLAVAASALAVAVGVVSAIAH
jgi:hypothetical protein